MYKAIIFDLDGTLLNTSYDIQKVLNASLARFNLPQVSLDKTIEYVGNGAKKLVERAVASDDSNLIESVYRDYSVHFAACDNNLTCLYPGEDEVLTRLKAQNVKFAIVTNKPQDATEGVYKKHLSKYNFEVVVGQSQGVPLKPSPESTLSTIKKLGVKKDECLFVGDGETDIMTAQNAGIDCVSVLWGYRSKSQLSLSGGKIFAENYEQLYDIVTKNV
jgi:phosphoglycolate phosphatase